MTINDLQDKIIADFEELEDSFTKFAYLTELATTLPRLTEEQKSAANLVTGCQSQVWLEMHCRNGKVELQGDSDTLIVRGILAIMVTVYSGRHAQEIVNADFYLLERAGLMDVLSTDRANGIAAILEKIHSYASACLGCV